MFMDSVVGNSDEGTIEMLQYLGPQLEHSRLGLIPQLGSGITSRASSFIKCLVVPAGFGGTSSRWSARTSTLGFYRWWVMLSEQAKVGDSQHEQLRESARSCIAVHCLASVVTQHHFYHGTKPAQIQREGDMVPCLWGESVKEPVIKELCGMERSQMLTVIRESQTILLNANCWNNYSQ